MNASRFALTGAGLVIAAASTWIPASAAGYSTVERWKLGPAAKWDYVTFDPLRHRLFIAHGDSVVVIDSRSGQSVGSFPANGAHGIALAEDLKLGFATNGKGNSVTVFDIETLKPKTEIPVSGDGPDAVIYEASVGKVFAFNGHSNTVSVIDARTLKEVTSLKTVGKPEFAQSNGSGKIYFNIESSAGQMQVIDAKTNQIVSTWPLPGCQEPSGLAIDIKSNRLFSVCHNNVMVVTDASTGKQVAKLPIGDDPDAAGFDPRTGMAFSSNGGSGNLTIVHEDDADHFTVVENIATEKSARTMALDSETGRIYLPSVVAGTMSVVVVAPK